MADGVKTTDNLTTKLVDWFEASEESTEDSRRRSQKARDYVDNKQWTADEIAILEDRGQPALAFNFIKPKVNFLTGFEAQSRSDPKAFPRNTGHDDEASEAATDAIRFVQDSQDLPDKFADVYDNMLVEGYGAIEVLTDAQGEFDIKCWHWDRLFYDPHSSRPDFSDAKYVGGVVWMDVDDAKRKYPGKNEAIDATVAGEPEADKSGAETFDDKPRWKVWSSLGKRKRIRVVQIYWRDGDIWHFAHYTKGGILKGGTPVPFSDGKDGNECPLIMESAYVDRENNRYGEVQAWMDVQDEYNKRRSRLLYEALATKFIADKGAVDNVDEFRKQMARPDGIAFKNIGRDLIPLEDSNSLNVQANMLELARNDMQQMGPSATLQGDAGEQASGRAIIASQQGGIVEIGRLISRYRRLRLRTYRQIWNRIQQFWKEEKWIRVTDDEQSVRFVGLNRPITALEELQRQVPGDDADDEALQQFDQDLRALEANPQLAQDIVRVENKPAEMDMDIILDETPDIVAIQQEQFSEMMALAQSGAVQFTEEEIIMLSSLRNKDKFLEARKKRQEEQGMSPEQEVQVRALVADIMAKEAQAEKTQAETQQIHVETQTDAFNAGLEEAQQAN